MAELGFNSIWDDEQPWISPNSDGEDGGKKFNLNIVVDEQTAKDDHEEAMPPPAPKGKKRSADDKTGGGESDHELHIYTERERRKRMRNMFASLHALLPHLPPKTDKSTIVDEAITYVKKLQQIHSKLQKQKLERMKPTREAFLAQRASTSNPNPIMNPNPLFLGPELPVFTQTWTSPNLVMNVSGRDAHINVCGSKKPGLFMGICFLMEKYKLEVISAQVSSDQNRCMCLIHTRLVNGASDPFLAAAFPVEDIYKQVAGEIMLWVNS